MGPMLRFFHYYRWPLLSGILLGTSYIPFPPWALIFCLAPLWYFVLSQAKDFREAFIAAWWTQFIFSMIGFYWVAFAAKEFGFLPWPLAIVILVIFAAGVHLYYPVAAALVFQLRKRYRLSNFASLVLLATLVGLAEVFWPSMFPWNLGYPWLAAGVPVFQWADAIGFLGLSWLTHLSSASFAYLSLKRGRGWVWPAAMAALFLVMAWTGTERKKSWTATDTTIQVLQIQANIGNADKHFAKHGVGYQQVILDEYFVQTRSALAKFPNVDLIVWPETAFPEVLDEFTKKEPLTAQFYRFLEDIKTPLLTGADSADRAGAQNQALYNGLFLFDENAVPLGPAYRKTHLLAFGESTPLSNVFPWLKKFSPAEEGLSAGDGPHVFPFQGILGVQICYEGLYPHFTRELALQKADWIVNITNDAWFGATSEPHQHLYMTFGRAIEARRPLVRTTNTGISSTILANGELLAMSPIGEPWAGLQQVRFLKEAPLTIYTKFGDWWPYFLLTVGCATLLCGRSRLDS